MSSTPIGPPKSPDNDRALVDAAAAYLAALRLAAEQELHGVVYAKAGLQGGRLNTHKTMDVPTAVR